MAADRWQTKILLNTLRRSAIRVVVRGTWFLAELALAALEYPVHVTLRREGFCREARARWLQRACRRLLRVFEINCRITGTLPSQGLLVSNHLSYLDILVLGAVFPCAFVAKYDVRNWPVFGRFARMAGTVFIRRDKRSDVVRASGEITEALNEGALVVLFPEGTSSRGDTVLPFKPALFSSVVDYLGAITSAVIDYSLDDGSHWTEFDEGLPHSAVSWIVVPKLWHDVVVSTYGRGIFVLRDIAPLELQGQVADADVVLYPPHPGYRQGRGGSSRPRA